MFPVGIPPPEGTVNVLSAQLEALGLTKQYGAPLESDANEMMVEPSTIALWSARPAALTFAGRLGPGCTAIKPEAMSTLVYPQC